MNKSQQILHKMLEKDAFSKWLGLEIDEITEGGCHLHFTPTADMCNGFETVHGGVLFSSADSAFAFACNSHGRLAVALDVSITFTRAAKVGERLDIHAKELYLGNKTSVYEVKIQNKAGDLVALFKGTAYRTSKDILKD
jgi:acyl-CoA thioesterase